MKAVLIKNGFHLLLILVFAIPLSNKGQTITYSESIGRFNDVLFCQAGGELNNRALVLQAIPFQPNVSIYLFDSLCSTYREKQLPFIPTAGLLKTNIYSCNNSWDIFWQTLYNKHYYTCLARLNEDGELLEPPVLLDSFNIYERIADPVVEINNSPGNKYFLLSRAVYDSKNKNLLITLKTITINGFYDNTSQLTIPFDQDLEKLSSFLIDDEKNIYCARYDYANNYKLGTTIDLYHIDGKNNVTNFPGIYIREKKPVEILMKQDNQKIFLASMYADFYSGNTKGSMIVEVNKKSKIVDSVFNYPYSDSLLKVMHRGIFGIPRKMIMNYATLKDFEFLDNNEFLFLFDFTKNTYVNHDDFRIQPSRTSYIPPSEGGLTRFINTFRRRNQASANANNWLNPTQSFPVNSQPRNVAASNSTIHPAPIDNKTLIIRFASDLSAQKPAVFETLVRNEMDYSLPISFITGNNFARFSYELNQKDHLVLNQVINTPENNDYAVKQIGENSQYLLLLNHPFHFTSQKKFFTFYQDKENNRFGLAKINW